MALILHIETATKNCSVSLGLNGQMLDLKELNEGQFSHAEKLHVFIEEILSNNNKSVQDLDAIAVSKGPGSYTGLRIGVSAAKGLCFAAQKPLIAIPTLESLAHAISVKPEALIVPMIDARRLEVYCAVYNGSSQEIKPVHAKIIDQDSFAEYNDKEIYFLGDGAEKCKDIITVKKAQFIKDVYPSAKEMIGLAFDRFNNKQFEDVAYFEPYYLKDFIAGKPKNLALGKN